MMDAKEIIQSVGTILTNFLKTGSTSPNHTEEIKAQIYEIALPLITSPEEATENYKKVCKDFLTQTLKAKGLPTRAMFGGGQNQSNVVSSSSKHIAQNFNSLRPHSM